MASPFPGMDPYLEAPDVWRGVHARLVSASSDLLQPQAMSLGFFVDIDERIWLEEPERNVYPDLSVIRWSPEGSAPEGRSAVMEADAPVLVRSSLPSEVRETFLQIIERDGNKLVTQIEFISPANKSASSREFYLQKRKELQDCGVNTVEIDLLRSGKPVVDLSASALESLRPWHYLVCIARHGTRDRESYPIKLPDRLPRIIIPLKNKVPDLVLDLQTALERVYQAGPYVARIDYQALPTPPLDEVDARWAAELIKK